MISFVVYVVNIWAQQWNKYMISFVVYVGYMWAQQWNNIYDIVCYICRYYVGSTMEQHI